MHRQLPELRLMTASTLEMSGVETLPCMISPQRPNLPALYRKKEKHHPQWRLDGSETCGWCCGWRFFQSQDDLSQCLSHNCIWNCPRDAAQNGGFLKWGIPTSSKSLDHFRIETLGFGDPPYQASPKYHCNKNRWRKSNESGTQKVGLHVARVVDLKSWYRNHGDDP